MQITFYGAGAWGTALASHMAKAHQVTLWGRDPQVLALIQTHQQNSRYLPGVSLNKALQVQPDFEAAVSSSVKCSGNSTLWVLGVPVSALRQTLERLKSVLAMQDWPVLIWLCKGFEVGTGYLPHQIVAEVTQGLVAGGTLTGPSFAREVALGLPCALCAASTDAVTRQVMVQAAHHHSMRIYELSDVIGAEVGGAVKNIMALATGISDGLGLGLNARAALITRGLAEMSRLADILGAQSETLNGLSGLGDLTLTCTGDLSRNRQAGFKLAQGKSLNQILQELGQVAEGVRCAPVVLDLANTLQVSMPIVKVVNAMLFEGLSPTDGVTRLLSRQVKHEFGE